jgi:putative hemolysin
VDLHRHPLRNVVRLVADRVTTFVVGEHVGRENILKADELRTLMADSEETGVIQASERVLIDKVLERRKPTWRES